MIFEPTMYHAHIRKSTRHLASYPLFALYPICYENSNQSPIVHPQIQWHKCNHAARNNTQAWLECRIYKAVVTRSASFSLSFLSIFMDTRLKETLEQFGVLDKIEECTHL